MKATLEIVGAIIRVYPDDAKPYAPFDASLFVVADDRTATLKGLVTDRFTTAHRNAIVRCLRENGFEEAVWYRWSVGEDGRPVRREMRFSIPKEPSA